MRRSPATVAPSVFDEATASREALAALDRQRWQEASARLLELARRNPNVTRYRALLAYARGQEAWIAGDDTRAREEWRRALILDPSLREATEAARTRARRPSWLGRLLRPS